MRRRTTWPQRGAHLAAVALALSITAAASACPTDKTPRAADTLLTVQAGPALALALSRADLAALAPTTLTQRLQVSSSSGGSAERSLAYGGVLLRDLLLKAGFGGPADRSARTGIVEAVATDGYRAVFSWGELFNGAAGEQVLVITTQDGQPLDAVAGPLALRALGDLRPGPRHVRNLCAVRVGGLP
jgi:hypothetical protein